MDKMNPPIGFVLMTHANPRQIERLVGRLNGMFNHPPIVCHHDFSKCALPTESFSKNISFVRPHLRTAWGEFTLIQAQVRAIEQMYAAPGSPDYLVLISGSDYPIKPAAQILNDLQTGDYDAHILFELIRYDALKTRDQKMHFERYCTRSFRVPFTKRIFTLSHPFLTRPLFPFTKNFQCYAGSNWFCANRRAAKYIVEFYESNPKVARHYQRAFLPEESYFQAILANAPGFKLNNNNWRYIDWSPGGPHPKTLGLEDLPKLLASPDHFARKFDPEKDSAVLDELDRITA